MHPKAPPNATGGPSDPRLATSLVHGLEVLEALADAGQSLSNGALSRRTGLSRASVSRLTLALQSRGLVDEASQSLGFRPGLGALSLGYPLLARWGLRQLARPAMLKLAQAWGGSVSLGLLDRQHMLYVETVRASDPPGFQPEVGARLPLLPTAMGRAWLACADEAELAQLTAWAPAGLDLEPVRAAQARARQQLEQHGYCLSVGEWLRDIQALALPLKMHILGQRLILNLGLPIRRRQHPDFPEAAAADLRALARLIEGRWAEAAPDMANRVPTKTSPAAWVQAVKPPPLHPTARTLCAGLDVLGLFGPGRWELGNRDIARLIALSPQTVARLTFTLCQRGYLQRRVQPGGHPRYQLGWAALAPTQALLADLRLRRRARQTLLTLSRELGAAVSLGLEHRAHMVYVETVWRTDGRAHPPDIGAPMPLLSSAMGRAWLGQAVPQVREQTLNRLRVAQAEDVARHLPAALEAVDFFQAHGWCLSEDFQSDIIALATPVQAPAEGRCYVLNAGLWRAPDLEASRLQAMASRLCEAARQLEQATEA